MIALRYWFEIRRRVLWCCSAFVMSFLIMMMNVDWLYETLLLSIFTDDGGHMIATDIAEPLVMPIKLSYYASIFMVMPLLIYHAVSFIGPALYRSEKQLVNTLVLLATVLFYLGALIGVELIQPLIVHFTRQWLPTGVLFLPSIGSYFDFLFDLAFAFGLAFEIPVLLLALILLNWVEVDSIRNKRSWWVVGIFVFSMICTPPDVISQLCLACPLWLFVELSLLIGSYLMRRKNVLLDLSD